MANPNALEPVPSTLPPEPPRRGWFARNWLWAVPVGCLVPVVGCVGLVAVGSILLINQIKSSDVYQEAIQLTKANAAVAAAIGEPMTERLPTTFKYNLNNTTGTAQLTIPVDGPKGFGVIFLDAVRANGAWTYNRLEFQPSGGAPIPLIDPPAG